MARGRSPNRLGTKLEADFVKDAIDTSTKGHNRRNAQHDMFVR